MKHLTLLGSTGSIGCSTLDVVRHNPDSYTVTALVAGKNVQRMVEQCMEFTPRFAVMDDEESARQVKALLQEKGCRTEVLSGQQAACDMASLDEVDQVMAAIVCSSDLQSSGRRVFCRRLPLLMREKMFCLQIKSRWSPADAFLWRR